MVENEFHNPKEGRETRHPVRLGPGQRTVLSNIYEGNTVAVFCHPKKMEGLVLLSKDLQFKHLAKAARFKNQYDLHGEELDESKPIIFKGTQIVVVHHPESDEIIKARLIQPGKNDKPYMQLEFGSEVTAVKQPVIAK